MTQSVEELLKQEELKIIRPTENSAKECDGEQPSQTPVSLFYEGQGIPDGVKVGGQ